jgi:hypothetical protein
MGRPLARERRGGHELPALLFLRSHGCTVSQQGLAFREADADFFGDSRTGLGFNALEKAGADTGEFLRSCLLGNPQSGLLDLGAVQVRGGIDGFGERGDQDGFAYRMFDGGCGLYGCESLVSGMVLSGLASRFHA